jgi:mannose-6-phosphate isomerase
VDANGQPRPLHLDKALEVINFQQIEPAHAQPQLIQESDELRRELLVSCPYFNVERVTFKEAQAVYQGHTDGSTFEIWGILTGQGRVSWADESLHLFAVRFTLLPAALGDFAIKALEPAVFLRAYVPE